MRRTESAFDIALVILILFIYASPARGQDLFAQFSSPFAKSSPPAKTYLSGIELAELYEKHTFCYAPSDTGACGSTEEMETRSATKIRIVRSDLAMKTNSRVKTLEGMIVDNITSGTQINPEAVQFLDQQTWTLTASGLCRTKAQAISDANSSRGQWVVKASNTLAKPVPWSLEKLASYRLQQAREATEQIGEVTCAIYWYDANQKLRSNTTIDNIIQAGDPETVRLLPRGQLHNLYVQ
jgi:hypothetical protein